MYEFIQLILSLFSLLLFLTLLYLLIRVSVGGLLVAVFELFFIFGVLLAPILYLLGIAEPAHQGENYILAHGWPGLEVALHVFLYTLGALAGYGLAKKKKLSKEYSRYLKYSTVILKNHAQAVLIFISLFLYFIYFYLVGFDNALIEAAAMRRGNFEGIGVGQKYVFLKSIAASLAIVVLCMMPYRFANIKEDRSHLLVVLIYLFLVVMIFFNSISRSAILSYILAPIMIAFSYKQQKPLRLFFNMLTKRFLLFSLLLCLGFFILVYGKSFASLFRVFLQDGDFVLKESSLTNKNFILSLVSNSEYTYFSISAGISNFFSNGPFLGLDVLYSPIAFIPTKFLELVGLGMFAKSNIPEDMIMQCYNSFVMNSPECNIPAGNIAFVAYIFPWGGALIYGLLKFYFYSKGVYLWRLVQNVDFEYTWVVYFYLLFISRLLSFNPGRIAEMMFVVLFLTMLSFVNRVKIRY